MRRHSQRHRDEQSSRGKRADIQGLRAVAVVVVVVNHLTGHPRGGFVGVDVFFVISGYLITGLLIRDLGRQFDGAPITAWRYISNFYRRRVRRLLPAALVVIVLTIGAAHVVFNPARSHHVRVDGLWSAILWANWHFIDLGTDYFTAGLPESPFQHYWSLSVEEQFYVVWPIALLVLAVLVGRRRSEAARMTIGAIAAVVLCAACLVVAAKQSSSDPTTAYFSTFTRGWELGLGALAACLVPRLPRMPWAMTTALSWTGLALIGVSLFVTHGGTGFPFPGAILPCAGALLVVAVDGRAHEPATNVVLTNRVAEFIGDISYSVYLVHFPVIIILAEYMPGGHGYFYATATLLIIGTSVALYALVERPVLQSRWLRPKGVRERTAAAAVALPLIPLALAAAACVVLAACVDVVWPGTQSATDQKLAKISAAVGADTNLTGSTTGPEQAALTRQIAKALQATSWPKLSPSFADLDDDPVVPRDLLPCGNSKLPAERGCVLGDPHAPHTAFMVGDSTSMTYAEAFRRITALTTGWKVRVAGAYGCNFDTLTIRNGNKDLQNGCAHRNVQTVAAIRRARPDLVFVTNFMGATVTADGRTLTDQQWGKALGDELAKIAPFTGKIVILPASPATTSPANCYRPSGTPTDCVSGIPQAWFDRGTVERNTVARLHGAFIDPELWFCTHEYCPAFVGTTPTKRDVAHVTVEYDDVIAPAMLETLRSAGLLRAA